eukprot:366038-Chlamydomonas_euryale.AAC.4
MVAKALASSSRSTLSSSRCAAATAALWRRRSRCGLMRWWWGGVAHLHTSAALHFHVFIGGSGLGTISIGPIPGDPRRSTPIPRPPISIGVDRTPGTVGEVLKPPETAFEMVPDAPPRASLASPRRLAGRVPRSFFRTAFRTARL